MRVISGKYRGRKLVSPMGDGVRPTIDRVKQSIFNTLQFEIMGAKVLDLFAGAGSYGIECISRGAESVIFNDIQKTSLQLVKQNTNGFSESFELWNNDFATALLRAREEKLNFDIIFIDAPFNCGYVAQAVDDINEYDLINVGGYIVIESENCAQIPKGNCEIFKIKSYTNVTVTILRRN